MLPLVFIGCRIWRGQRRASAAGRLRRLPSVPLPPTCTHLMKRGASTMTMWLRVAAMSCTQQGERGERSLRGEGGRGENFQLALPPALPLIFLG